MEKNGTYSYDVALSFAGEDREYVEEVAIILKGFGVKVFYDKFEETELWGKNLFEHLNDVYRNKARYTVMFISRHYKEKLWTNHERRSMQERAFSESSEYILPVRFDDTEIPGLHSTVGYLNLNDKPPGTLAKIICSKIGWITKSRWWGEWDVETVHRSYFASLTIRKVHNDHFQFSLLTANGAHSGKLSGDAYFTSNNEAIFRRKTSEDKEDCILKFFKTNDIIQIDESRSCLFYHGMRAYFGGDYKLKKDVFYKFDFINDHILTKLYDLLKEDLWEDFLKCFGDVFYDDEHKSDKKIIKGGVPGLYTLNEGILIIDKLENIWGAFLDVDNVYYFTSEENSGNRLPEIIEEWRTNFKEIEVTYITTIATD
jgi:hypothetical protein